MTRGNGSGRRIDELRAEAKRNSQKALGAILETMCQNQAPDYDAVMLDHICKTILQKDDRVNAIKALMISIMGKDNPYRISPGDFAQLSDCREYIALAAKVAESTIANFIDVFSSNKPQSPSVVAAYLYGLSALRRYSHSCFDLAVPQFLVRMCEPLATFEKALHWSNEQPVTTPTYSASEIVAMGREMYHLLSRGNHGVTARGFYPILQLRLFRGLQPVLDDTQLESPEYQRNLTAIRLGVSGAKYVVSRLAVSKIIVGDRTNPREVFFYIRTWMRSSPTGKAAIRSHGFIIPRRPHIYLAQYHLEGHGLNIAALSPDELADGSRSFFRGIILAADRETSTGALTSKIVFLEANHSNLLIGDFAKDQLMSAISAQGLNIDFGEVFDYIHGVGSVSVRAPVSAGVPVEQVNISSWRELMSYLNDEKVRVGISKLHGPSDDIYAYLHRPIRPE